MTSTHSPPNDDETSLLRTWSFDLPWTSPPLSLNGARGNHYARARLVKRVRTAAALLTRSTGIPPVARCAVELHYAPRNARRRDAHNIVATLKACEDGLVDAGVVPDDDDRYVQATTPTIHPPTGEAGRVWVVVRELPARPQ